MEQSSVKRLTWIDLAKGFLILAVILGHSTNYWHLKSYLGYFYMPMFFFLSGYTLKKTEVLPFLKKKVKTLLLPYVGFALLFIAYKSLRLLVFETPFDILEGLISIVLPYSGRVGGTVYELWFLPCLFLAEILFILLLSNKKSIKILTVLLEIAIFIVGILFLPYTSLVLAVAFATLFIAFGYVCKSFNNIKVLDSFLAFIIAIVIHLACFIINTIILENHIDFSSGAINIVLLWLPGVLTGIIAYSYLLKKICKFSPLEYVGKNSLYFYCFHYIVLSLVTFVVDKVTSIEIIKTIICFVMVTAITMLVVVIYNYLKKKVKKICKKPSP